VDHEIGFNKSMALWCEEQSFSLLVLSDGRVWRLQGRLFGPVRAEESKGSGKFEVL